MYSWEATGTVNAVALSLLFVVFMAIIYSAASFVSNYIRTANRYHGLMIEFISIQLDKEDKEKESILERLAPLIPLIVASFDMKDVDNVFSMLGLKRESKQDESASENSGNKPEVKDA